MQQVPLLVKSKSCAAVVESKVLFEGELSISLLFQDNFHNAYVRIKDSGELLEYQNDASKMPTNTYDLKTCWIDQSVDRHAGKRTSSSVSTETHQVVLVRAKGGPPVSLRTAQVQMVSNLLLTLSRFTLRESADPDLESFQAPTVLASIMGRILSVNKQLLDLFGYSTFAELESETVSVLMEDKVASLHGAFMDNYRLTGATKMMGRGTVVRVKDAAGKTFPVMIYLGRFSTPDGREERLIASFVKRGSAGLATPDRSHRSSSYHLSRTTILAGYEEVKLEVVDLLCTHIELYGSETEGVFRLSGSAAEVDKLVAALHSASSIYDIDLEPVNLHVVTGALKKYLTNPLIVGELYNRFIAAAEEPDSDKRLENLLHCVLSMPVKTMAIFRRLWMLFGQIVASSSQNKMNDQNLGICMSPLLTNPAPEVLLQHSQVFSDIFSTLITQYDRVYDLFPQMASASSYRLFSGPPPLDQNEWNLLLSNADRKSFASEGLTIIEEGTQCHDMFYIQEGTVVLKQAGVEVTRLIAGHIVSCGCFLGMDFGIATVKSGKNGCVTQRINSLYLDKLFNIEKQLCMKFCWQQARDLAKMWLNMPVAGLDIAELDLIADGAEDIATSNPKEFPVHLSDGRVHVFEFHPAMSVALMVEVLKRTYPKECRKNPVLFEKIGDKTLEVLQPTALMGALQVRCNFANAPYKVIFPLHKDKQSNKRRASSRKRTGSGQGGTKGASELKTSGGSDGGGPVNLLENEQDMSVMIKEFTNCCRLKKKLGSLVLLHNCMIHTSTKLLGFESRFVLMYNDVNNVGISKGDNTLLLDTLGEGLPVLHKLKFKEASVCGEVFDLLRSLCRGTNIAKKVSRSESAEPQLDLTSLNAVVGRVVPELMALFVEQYTAAGETVRSGALMHVTGGLGTGVLKGELVGCAAEPLEVPAEKVDLMLHVWFSDLLNTIFEAQGYALTSGLPTATDWDRLLTGAQLRRFKPGQRIVQEGSCLQRVYCIVTGTCRIEQRATYDQEHSSTRADTLRFTSAYLGPGDMFGVAGFITGSTVEAVVAHDASLDYALRAEEIVVAVIEAKHLEGLFERDYALASRFYKLLMTLLHTRLRSSMRERSSFSLGEG